jgi:hypothetical protein
MTSLVRVQCDSCNVIAEAPMPRGWATITGNTFVTPDVHLNWKYDLCSYCYKAFGPTVLNPENWGNITLEKDGKG